MSIENIIELAARAKANELIQDIEFGRKEYADVMTELAGGGQHEK